MGPSSGEPRLGRRARRPGSHTRAERRDGAEPRLRFGDADGALALAFAIGGLQGLVMELGPHWYVQHPGVVGFLSGLALGTAPIIWLFRGVLDQWMRHLFLVTASLMASVSVWACGPNPSTLAVAYVYALIVLYAAAFFSARAVTAHLVTMGALYAGALGLNPTAGSVVQWVQAMAALTVTAVIVINFAQELRRTAAARAFALYHDPLTGLGNRALFLNRLDQALGSLDRRASSTALLCVNVDDFRTVNASVGKDAGDELLVAIAGRLVGATRPQDTIARLGGDDFAVLVDAGPMPQTARSMAERIATTIARPFSVAGVSVSLEASIGIALADVPGVTAADLLRDADVALYMAKKRGKGQIELIRPGMRDEAMEHLALVADLRHAVEAEEFEVHYQPIVDARGGRPVGVEALVRWRHPTRGLVAPGAFVPIAESEGLIVPLGQWVLLQSCRQARQWLDAGVVPADFYVSVNVSAVQLAQPSIVDDVAAALTESGLAPSALVLEVTESALMLDVEAGRERMYGLSGLGTRIALDDFGTGYSSLNRLRSLPVDILKIDKSFVDHVSRGNGDRAVVQTVITVGHNVGATVVAEGVETAAQLATLRELGCDAVQGYYFARPAPAERAIEIVADLATVAKRPAISRSGYSSSG